MEENNKPNKKLIFSTEENQKRDLLEEKGVNFNVDQQKYQKGDDIDSDILSGLINQDEELEGETNSELLTELASYNEYDEDLAVKTEYQVKHEKTFKFLKKLFLVTLIIFLTVVGYFYQQGQLDMFLEKENTSISMKIEDLKNQYQSDLMYSLLQKSSILNQEIAANALNYIESTKIKNSQFKSRSEKLKADKLMESSRDEIQNYFAELKINLENTKNLKILDRDKLIEVINSNKDLDANNKSQLVEFMKYGPILKIVTESYEDYKDEEFLNLLLQYLEVTKTINLNNIALDFYQNNKFDQFLLDIQDTFQNYDPNFEIFNSSDVVSLLSLNLNQSDLKGNVYFKYNIQTQFPIQELIDLENKFMESQKFNITKSTTFKAPRLSEQQQYEPVEINLAFNYNQS